MKKVLTKTGKYGKVDVEVEKDTYFLYFIVETN